MMHTFASYSLGTPTCSDENNSPLTMQLVLASSFVLIFQAQSLSRPCWSSGVEPFGSVQSSPRLLLNVNGESCMFGSKAVDGLAKYPKSLQI